VGGGSQAQKEASYMYTAVGTTCADNTAMAAYCAVSVCRVPAHSTQNTRLNCNSAGGRLFCAATCGKCDATVQIVEHSTEARESYCSRSNMLFLRHVFSCLACTPFAACYNATMCSRSGVAGGGTCTTDGNAADSTATPPIVTDGGVCDCAGTSWCVECAAPCRV